MVRWVELIQLWEVNIPHELEHTHKPQATDLAQGGKNIPCTGKAEPLSGGGHGALSHRPQAKINKRSLLRALAACNSSKAPKIPSRRHGSREFYTSPLSMSTTALGADNMPTDLRGRAGTLNTTPPLASLPIPR